MTITIEQIRKEWEAFPGAIGDTVAAVGVLLQAISERDATIAELRKPVAMERNDSVESLRRRYEQRNLPGCFSQPHWVEVQDLLSAYDTIAQNAAHLFAMVKQQEVWAQAEQDSLRMSLREQTAKRIELQRDAARDASARDALLAEIKRLREQLADLQQFHDWAEPQVVRIGKEIVARESAEERERQLRDLTQAVHDDAVNGQSMICVVNNCARLLLAERDKDRLDWLSANAQDDNHGCRYFEWRHDVTLGAAIDAARGAK